MLIEIDDLLQAVEIRGAIRTPVKVFFDAAVFRCVQPLVKLALYVTSDVGTRESGWSAVHRVTKKKRAARCRRAEGGDSRIGGISLPDSLTAVRRKPFAPSVSTA